MRNAAIAEVKSRPIWISHRGFKDAAVENTREAFVAAKARGFQALETDLRLTRDGEIVLHHDPDLRRLAGREERVQDLSRAQLEGIPLGGHGSGCQGSKLFFFEDFVQEFAGCGWTFDIKPETGLETVHRLKVWSDAHRAGDLLAAQAKFVFWDRRQEALCREFFPDCGYYAHERECYRAGAAVCAGTPRLSGIVPGRIYALTARLFGRTLFRHEVAAAYQARGAKVVAFLPVNDVDARAAALSGFDEILTNGPIVTGGQ